jgi:catechol 2,3-dioxygenase-like lactoylglutathione lyase family enzyme
MINKLFAICLLVKDFDKSMNFYKDVLGLELNSQDGGFADFKMDGTSLAIFERKAAESMFPGKYMGSAGGAVYAFQVEDVQKTHDALVKKGVTFIEDVKTTSWGQIVTYFTDPDGNIWEISKK